jgi:hypothetical protein
MCTHPVNDGTVATPLERGLRAFQYRRTLPALFAFPFYSLNNGLTKNGYSENAQFRHSDKAPGWNLDAIASRLSSTNG